jgi:hypothetical protein
MLLCVSSSLSTHYVNNNFGSDKIFYLQKLWASFYSPKGLEEKEGQRSRKGKP